MKKTLYFLVSKAFIVFFIVLFFTNICNGSKTINELRIKSVELSEWEIQLLYQCGIDKAYLFELSTINENKGEIAISYSIDHYIHGEYNNTYTTNNNFQIKITGKKKNYFFFGVSDIFSERTIFFSAGKEPGYKLNNFQKLPKPQYSDCKEEWFRNSKEFILNSDKQVRLVIWALNQNQLHTPEDRDSMWDNNSSMKELLQNEYLYVIQFQFNGE